MNQVTFVLNKKDILGIWLYYRIRGRGRAITLLIPMMILTIFILVPIWVAMEKHDFSRLLNNYLIIIPPLCIGLGIALAWFIFVQYVRFSEMKKMGLFGNPTTFRLQPDGIWIKGYRGEGLNYWHQFTEIVSDTNHIFIFLKQTLTDYEGIAIPKSAFSTPDECREFYNTAVEFWEAKKADLTCGHKQE